MVRRASLLGTMHARVKCLFCMQGTLFRWFNMVKDLRGNKCLHKRVRESTLFTPPVGTDCTEPVELLKPDVVRSQPGQRK